MSNGAITIAAMKAELAEHGYTADKLATMSNLEIANTWYSLPVPTTDPFGIVHWTDDDIEAVFEERGYTCTPADIRAIRDACNARIYGIRDAMIEAGWGFIHAAVENHHRAKEEGIA